MDWKTIRRVRQNAYSQNPTPTAMQINITGRCPCHCWHCEKATVRDGLDLPLPYLIECLDQAQVWGCPVLLTGGEPLVHRQWREILRAGQERRIPLKMITSGLGLARLESADTQLLVDSLSEMLISIDSADATTHDRLRGHDGLFAGVMDFLAGRPRPRNIWLVHVPSLDLKEVQPMIELAARLAVGLIVQPYIFISNFPHLQPLAVKSDATAQLAGLAATAATRAHALAREAERAGVVSNIGEVATFIGKYYELATGEEWFGHHVLPGFSCSVPWQEVTINEWGQLQPCVFMKGSPAPPTTSLAEGWRQQALSYREHQLAGQTWPQCRSCTCHFSTNFRNSLLLEPWTNRAGWEIAMRKKIMRIWPRLGAKRPNNVI